ncbi:cation-dependent mannose-6-phosphate receptor-like isoform X2 [Mercenaria mercenaria]|nr:cation-dependent mannose-6-phosphate receptor-like isoform X2 [Mercenaria mercenaria]
MIDLSSVGNTDGNPLFYDLPSTLDEFLYSYNPCGPFTELTCVDVAACQYSPYYYTGYDIGVPDKVSFNYDGLNVIANYVSQDGTRQSFITLVCDPGAATPSLDVMGESTTTQYYMTLTSAAACPVPSPFGSSGGISGGSVLLIIFFVLLAVYLATGVAFNKFRRSASGKELIPNLNFWTELPALVRDGVKYSLSLVCKRKSGYGAV